MSALLRIGTALSFALVTLVSTDANAQLGRECRYSCSESCIIEARQQQREARAVLDSCDAGAPRPNPGPRPRPGSRISVYRSDSCSSSLVATLDSYTDCDSMANGQERVWGIAINGQCADIADTTLSNACVAFKDAGDYRAVKFYRSDSCASSMVATASHSGRCAELSARMGAERVWAVEINGRCEDIADTDFRTACSRFAR